MGCIFDKPIAPEDKDNFCIDIDEELKTVNSNPRKLKRNYIINFQFIESKRQVAQENSRILFSGFLEENENKNKENQSQLNEYSIQDIRSICSEIKTPLKDYYLQVDEGNFSMKIIIDINRARKNYKEYSYKIDQLAKEIKTEENSPQQFLEFNSNDESYNIALSKGISSFDKSSYIIKNLNGKLSQLKIIEDNDIDFLENIKSKDSFLIQKNTDLLIEKFKEKYEKIKIFVVFIFLYYDPEMSNLISISDCDEKEGIRKTIFSDEITHVNVNSKKISDTERIVFYLFAKSLKE